MKKLQNKMLLFIFIPTVLFFVGMTVNVSLVTYNSEVKEGEELLDVTGEALAKELGAELEKPLLSVQTVSNTFAGMLEQSIVPKREDANIMLQQLFKTNPNIISAWMYWEPNAFDGKDEEFANTKGHDGTGRFIPVWSRSDFGDFIVEPLKDYDKPGVLSDNIQSVLETGRNVIWEPMNYDFHGVNQLVTSIVSPVVVNGKTVGMTGVDIVLHDLHKIVSEHTFYETGFAGLLSNEGNVISHQEEELIGTNYLESDAMKNHPEKEKVKQSILTGEKALITSHSLALDTEVYRLFTPIIVKDVRTPWSAFLAAPVDEVLKEARQLTTSIITTSVIALIILAGIILFSTRSIAAPIRQVVKEGQKMARGNFVIELRSKDLKRKDEIGQLAQIFLAISDSMSKLIGRVQKSSEQVLQSAETMEEGANQSASAANEVAVSIEEISRAAEEQMQSAEESAKAMEDMSQGVQQIANAASTVSETANEMSERVKEGQQTVQDAIVQMEYIQKETNATKAVIDHLHEEANQIEHIVSMITDISEQTNLLALNAAIEAARAGEAGKGFAVVAEEVRKLADQTKESATKIHKIIGAVQENTIQATESMNTSEQEVTKGVTQITAVGEVFEKIQESIQTVVQEIEDLAAVSEEMSAMSEEIAAASEEIATSAETAAGNTQQVAAAAEEQLATMETMKQTSESLKRLVQELNGLMRQFQVK